MYQTLKHTILQRYMYNLDMDGQDTVQVEGERLEANEDVVLKAAEYEESPIVESIEGEQVVAEVQVTAPVAVEPIAEAVVAPEPEPPLSVAPSPIPVVTPAPVEPTEVQETQKGENTEIIAVQQPEKVVESVTEVANTIVAPAVKLDPMEVARGLDHDVLEAAFRLLAQERSATLLDAKKKSDKKKVDENSDRVEKFVAQYKKGVRRTTIADKLNMSPSKVTDYLQRLIASGRVRGEGKTNDRRFYIS